MSDSAAVTVGGRYRLLKAIGKGGMGKVWQAHDEVLGRDVAVKEVVPPPDLTGPEREVFARRTFREARAAGRVAHPGVATVYDVLEEDGHPWIVMQLVRSRTLGEAIREDGPLEPYDTARIGVHLLQALRAAHAAGVLHRDVKPDNVLLAEDGRTVLTDFGIATTEDDSTVTRTGVLIGTPAFIAPERAAGGRASAASDLWSLGVTLYQAVEGHSPFQRTNPLTTLGAVMHAEPEPAARAGVLAPVLSGLLRKNPAERMTLDEAERRLTTILMGGSPDAAGPVSATKIMPTAVPGGTIPAGPGEATGAAAGTVPAGPHPSSGHAPAPDTAGPGTTAGAAAAGGTRAPSAGPPATAARATEAGPAGAGWTNAGPTGAGPTGADPRAAGAGIGPAGAGSGAAGGAGRRRRGVALAALAGGAVLVAAITGGAAWWSSRASDSSRPSSPTQPAVVTESSSRPSSEEARPEETEPPSQRTGEAPVPRRSPEGTPSPTGGRPSQKKTPARSPAPADGEEKKRDTGAKNDDAEDDGAKDDKPSDDEDTGGVIEGSQ
ncbi:Serine/threonine-protein kinase PrkC [Nonomuraea coxensis DSM 45129]|uniref:non-specific serine/threonine protein kinase n=1 Tax=Nonomuraea coxensis DSM 45129 TaxID=1122611 RepID=A0ABX8TYZ4_9ACTN|nr:serine/threonine-protein kinase [Nonomuraea coxensis]QYC40701.1 Serine/threonine-protein kinase PrkC [Nonomuraea coxensis DSM 45129]